MSPPNSITVAPEAGAVGANSIDTSDLVVQHVTEEGLVTALRLDGLHIDGGASVAVMGPSGCGKSTMLGLMAGLATPTQGWVRVGTTKLSELSESGRLAFRREHVGMVYQADNLLAHITVEENVALQRAICAREASRNDLGVAELLERLGIADLARCVPDQLSGGQRQRVAIARAVVHRPAVILADEPTGALDDANAQKVISLLMDVHAAVGATLVLVTHDPGIADHAQRTIHLTAPAYTGSRLDDPPVRGRRALAESAEDVVRDCRRRSRCGPVLRRFVLRRRSVGFDDPTSP